MAEHEASKSVGLANEAELNEPLHDPSCCCIGNACEQKSAALVPTLAQIRVLRQENAALRQCIERLERRVGGVS